MSVAASTWAWKIDLPATEKLVMLALADHANDEDFTCWPSLTHLEKKTGLNRTTVWRSIDRLIELGVVKRVGNKPAGSTIYLILVGAEITQVQETPRCTDHLGAQRTLTRCTAHLGVGAQRTPNHNYNHQEPSLLGDSAPPTQNSDFQNAWDEYPKRSGANLKRDAEKSWNARLKEGHTADEMLQGVRRYQAWCKENQKLGTEFVMQAKKFFGPAKPFTEEWATGPPKKERKVAL